VTKKHPVSYVSCRLVALCHGGEGILLKVKEKLGRHRSLASHSSFHLTSTSESGPRKVKRVTEPSQLVYIAVVSLDPIQYGPVSTVSAQRSTFADLPFYSVRARSATPVLKSPDFKTGDAK
jgi:hypothetical protein